MPYESKDTLVLGRQLKVQSLVIPFTVVGSATSTSVVLSSDEPGFTFLRTEGVDQITGALLDGETATFTTATNDANGIVQVLIRLNQEVNKVCQVKACLRDSATAQGALLGSATGITTGAAGGTALMLVVDFASGFNSAVTKNACLEVEYVLA